MCGIFGFAGKVSESEFERCGRLLRHRGPDAFGVHHDRDNQVHFAHCRLAIIDLSSNGAQPMCNETGDVWVVFNGEIYNFQKLRQELEGLGHVFKSNSDTEAILHAWEQWGTSAFKRLEGMFAFGLWDRQRRQLALVRDRVGIKPLYYAETVGGLAFASEPKAIVNLPGFKRKICMEGLADYLMYSYVAGSHSIWENIHQLLPGHYLLYHLKDRRSEISPYWQLNSVPRHWSEPEAIECLDGLLKAVVKEHLISDVSIGTFLSGGLDSTMVASYAAEAHPRIQTFTIGFQGWVVDETSAARVTSTVLGTTHHEEFVRADRMEDWMPMFKQLDEPIGNTSSIPTFLISSLVRRQVTVALSGDGGDEVFGGYKWYAHMERCRWRKRALFGCSPLIRALGQDTTKLGRRADRLHFYRQLHCPSFDSSEIRTLFPGLPDDLLRRPATWLYEKHFQPEPGGIKRWQNLDFHTFLPDSNLVYSDRASMLNSIEIRVPLLDRRIIEFAFSLPEHLSMSDLTQKLPLRKLLEKRGCGHVLQNRKQGFSCPVFLYWKPEDMAQEMLHGALVREGIVNPVALSEICRPEVVQANGLRIWLLMVLEKWFSNWMLV
ncbi:MAG: asparagine synthase (glutamine-hydrolyzing) [Verrucomicrobiota bacterium]